MKKLKNKVLNRISVTAFKKIGKKPICIMLDNVRSMNNVGSAFRIGDAFLIDKIYLGGITATPPHRDINKTALGATESVNWEYVADLKSKALQLQQEGYKVLVVEQVTERIMLDDFEPIKGEKYCLVFGNEVFGVADELIALANGCIEIPQYGTKHSLNISVSIGIVIWHLVSKLK